MDTRKPVTCIRYEHAGVAIRATADGVFIDGDETNLSASEQERIAKLKKLALERHRSLKEGRTPPASREPKWIDITQARRTT